MLELKKDGRYDIWKIRHLKVKSEIYDNWKVRQERKWKFRQLSIERVKLTVIGVCVA